MIIQAIKFRSGLSAEQVRHVMEERVPRYQTVTGLVQKYYVRDPATGEMGGIFLWDTEASLRAFRASDLARTIADRYRVIGESRVETFEVLFPLRSEAGAATRQSVAAVA